MLAKRASTWPRDHFCRNIIAPRRSRPTTWNVFLALSPNWSVKAEYLYVNFNNQTIGPGTFTLIENVVRGSVNYRF